MKKHTFPIAALCTLLAILVLAGCSAKPISSSSSTVSSSSSAVSSSASVSSPSLAEGATTWELHERIVASVNNILQCYRNGSLPAPIYYESEPGNDDHVPEGVVLPDSITWEDLSVEYTPEASFDEYYGMDVYHATGTLPLGDDYELVYYDAFPTDSYWDGRDPHVTFHDTRGTTTVPEVELATSGRFTDIVMDRIAASAVFSDIYLPGFNDFVNGSVTWEISNKMFHLHAKGDAIIYEFWYTVGEDYQLTLDYPNEALFGDSVQFSDEISEGIGQAAFDQFRTALGNMI